MDFALYVYAYCMHEERSWCCILFIPMHKNRKKLLSRKQWTALMFTSYALLQNIYLFSCDLILCDAFNIIDMFCTFYIVTQHLNINKPILSCS
jgi:dolichyl-phosphate-mannose--protein O-mannosyl transferase